MFKKIVFFEKLGSNFDFFEILTLFSNFSWQLTGNRDITFPKIFLVLEIKKSILADFGKLYLETYGRSKDGFNERNVFPALVYKLIFLD